MTATSPLLVIDRPSRRAAVATFPAGAPRPPHPPRPLGPRPGSPTRPPLRSIEGGRSGESRRRRRVYRQRRLVVVVAAVLGLLALGWGAQAGSALLSTPAADPAPVAVVDGPPAAAAAAVYVVQPGDTLWSIARRVRPDRDPRAVVDELSIRVPGGLQPGQQLDLTDLDG